MSRRFACALVVGKFCPLHLGHEFLIRQAQDAASEVIVLSYTRPGFAGYGSERRETWLKRRFPQLTCLVLDEQRLAALCREKGIVEMPPIPPDDAPDDAHRGFVAWLCCDLLRRPVDAVFTSESYGDGFAAFLSRHFGYEVRHVCVDQARLVVPISGTAIRRDPLAHRDFLAPEVYAEFIPRVCLLGGESTGKSSLAAALADTLETTWAAEYGRDLWQSRNGRLDLPDMLEIGRMQVAREERCAARADKVLICDTSPLTTLFYSQDLFGTVDDELRQLAERDYDLLLLCAPDFPFVQDGTRRTPDFRQHQHDWYKRALAERKLPYHELSGSPATRQARAIALIEQMLAHQRME